MNSKILVTFRPKSDWQKLDCINRSANYVCPNPSTLEAVTDNSIVRCCKEEVCKKRAAEWAVVGEEALLRARAGQS